MAKPVIFSLFGGTSSILRTFRAEPVKKNHVVFDRFPLRQGVKKSGYLLDHLIQNFWLRSPLKVP